MSELDDRVLARAKEGQAEALEQIILSYERLIYNIAYRYFPHKEDAKDIAQEALLKIVKNIRLCHTMEGFKAWAAKITVNTAIDELRRRKNKSAEALEDLTAASPEPTPDEALIHTETRQALMNAILQLPEDYRTMIILRDLQGLSYEELAHATDQKMGTVKSKLSRARNVLRTIISKWEQKK